MTTKEMADHFATAILEAKSPDEAVDLYREALGLAAVVLEGILARCSEAIRPDVIFWAGEAARDLLTQEFRRTL